MTRDVEERIVAMYFDNEDFEKKAKTTVETLGQLQKGLNLEDAAKGFSVFDKLSKAMNLDKAQKTLTKIKTTVGGMGSIFKKVFNLGPIDEAAAAVENFKNRYLNRVLGFDLAHTVANALEGAFRQLTIQPISAGWTQYENKMDSVKTIMSSTGESIETVQTHLEDLTTYANKTIYSLSDMTSNLGKFTNNGMKLEDSVQAMKGIANAAADAGQGAQQASMAMYNFSQAMGVGKMTTIDWKSIENANMATQRLKNTFIEMAAAQGELHKEFSETDKKYHYYITKNSKGQVEKDKKKWTEVTAKNFRETLSKDWLTSSSMMHALQIYSGEVIDPDTIKSWGITDPELIKQLEKIGKDALEAATQVRTFTKMMDALKEAAQSGWADTFELIFGNMEEGTNLWTRLNDTLDPILSKSAQTRNNMLKIWAGSKESTKEEESELAEKTESLKNLQDYLKKIEEENDLEGNLSKIDSMKNKIVEYKKQIADLKAEQAKNGKSATNVEQIERRQKAIKDYEKAIRELEKKNRDLKAKEDARTKNKAKSDELKAKIEQYKSEIKALQAADELDSEYDPDKSKKRQKQVDAKQKEIDKLQQQLNRINKTTGEDEIEKTKKEIKELQKEIDKLTGKIDEKNSKQKSEFVDEQGRSGRDIAIDSMFKLIELAQKFGETFSNAFHNVFGTMDAEKLFNITKGIGDAIESLFKWFTEGSDEAPSRLSKIQKGLQGVFSVIKTVVNFIKIGFSLLKKLVSPVADFLINVFEKFGEFFDGLGELSPVEVFEKLGEGLQKTWEKVKKFFTPQDILDKNGKATGQTEIPVITWLKNVWSKFKKTVQGWAEENGLGEVWTKVTDWWNIAKSTFERGKAKLDEVWNEVKGWFASSGISGFLSNTWSWIVSQFSSSGNIVSGYRNGRLESWYEEAPVVSWLSDIWEGIKTFWNETILGTAMPVWEAISEFAGNTWGWITDQFGSKMKSGYRNGRLESWYEEAPVVSWLSGIWESIESFWNNTILGTATPIWNAIAKFGSDTWGWITSQFTPKISSGYRNGRLESWYEKPPIVTWLSGIWEGIESFWNETILGTATPIWNAIAKFGSDTWGWITSQFAPKLNSGYRNGRLESWYDQAPVVSWLSGIWKSIESFWNNTILGTAMPIWEAISEFAGNTWSWICSLFGKSEEGNKDDIPQENSIVTWLKQAWKDIETFWNDTIVGSAKPIWESIAKFGSDTWGWIVSQFSSSGNIVSGYRNGRLESWYEEAPIVTWLSGIWEGVKGVWNEIVGWSGWSALGEFLSNTWTWITGLFAGSESSVAGASEAAVEASKQATITPEQTEEALGFFERIIGAISDFVTKIAESVSNTIIPEGVSKFLTGTAEFLNGFLGAIGDLLGKIGRVLSGKGDGSDVFAFVLTIITAISGIVGKILLAKWTSGMSDFTSFGTSFLAFSGGIMLIASAISLLTAIDQTKLGSALGVVEVVALTIGGILAALKAIGSGGAQQALAQTPTERFFTNLINKLASIGLITIILKEIPPIIEAVKNAKSDGAENIGDELLKIAEAIAVLFGTVTIMTIAVGKLGGSTGIDPKGMAASLLSLVEVFAVISLVALAVGGLGEAVDGIFGENSHEAVLEALNKAAEFMQGLGNVIGGFFMGLFGIKSDVAKTQDALQIADMLAEASSAFDVEKISGLSRMMTLIANLSDNTVKIDTGKMSDFGVAMGNIGDGIYTIATYISEVEGPLSEMHNPDSLQYKKLEGVLGFVERFGGTLSSFAPLIEAGGLNSKFRDFDVLVSEIKKLAEDGNLNSLTESLSKMMTKFSTDLPNGDTIQFDGIAIVGKLYDAIQTGLDAKGDLPQFDATSIVDAITLALSEGDLAIATIVHDMVQKGLGMGSGLVGDESGYTLPEYLIPKESTKTNNGNSAVNSLFGNLGLEDMESSIATYQEKLDALSLSFGNFETNLPDIGTSMKENGWTSLFSFEDEEGNATSMFEELQTQLGLVGDQLNEMGGLEVTITPVFTMENLTRDKLQSALDAELGGVPLSANATIKNPVVTIDFKEMSTELGIEDIRAKLQSLITAVAIADSNNQSAINRLGSDIDSVADAVASMQMYLDGDVLVGHITPRVDAELGRRSQVYDRTGVTFNIPKMMPK